MHLRKAGAHDYPDFARLFPELAIDDPVPAEEVFAREMVPTTLFAEIDGRVAGFAHWIVMTESAHLRIIITAPEARRRGIGRALMTAVRDELRKSGCRAWTLNVLPTNRAAIALYEAMGMRLAFRASAMRVAWSAALRMPRTRDAKPIAPGDDDAIEHALGITPGTFQQRRSLGGRALLCIEENGSPVAACAFDPAFPGALPFQAKRVDLATSLLHAMRPYARTERDMTNFSIDGEDDVVKGLLDLGATLRFETLRMRGDLNV